MFRFSSLGQCCCSITRTHPCILRPLYERTDNVGSRNDVACSRCRSCLPHDLSFGSVRRATSRPVVPLEAARQRACLPETFLRRRAASGMRFIRSYRVFAESRPGVVAKQLTAGKAERVGRWLARPGDLLFRLKYTNRLPSKGYHFRAMRKAVEQGRCQFN